MDAEGGPRSEIGGYRIIAPIGVGSSATVYRALNEATGQEVAIKLLADNHSLLADHRRRFLAEVALLDAIDSRSVARIYGLGETATGQPYMVLELADRGDLRHRLDEVRAGGAVPARDDLVTLGRFLAESLMALHRAGIVHRDVSPGNILIRSERGGPEPEPGSGPGPGPGRSDGRPGEPVWGLAILEPGERFLLADLGFAKDLTTASGLTAGGGTRGFAAPEQRNDVTIVDQRADVFSATAVMEWAARGAGLDDALAAFFATGLAEDPADRFAAIETWYEGLRLALGGGPGLVPPTWPPAPAEARTPNPTRPPSLLAPPRAPVPTVARPAVTTPGPTGTAAGPTGTTPGPTGTTLGPTGTAAGPTGTAADADGGTTGLAGPAAALTAGGERPPSRWAKTPEGRAPDRAGPTRLRRPRVLTTALGTVLVGGVATAVLMSNGFGVGLRPTTGTGPSGSGSTVGPGATDPTTTTATIPGAAGTGPAATDPAAGAGTGVAQPAGAGPGPAAPSATVTPTPTVIGTGGGGPSPTDSPGPTTALTVKETAPAQTNQTAGPTTTDPKFLHSPRAYIRAPADGATVTGALTVQGDATSRDALTDVLLEIKNLDSAQWWHDDIRSFNRTFVRFPVPVTPPGSVSATWSYSLPAGTLPAGSYYVRVWARSAVSGDPVSNEIYLVLT